MTDNTTNQDELSKSTKKLIRIWLLLTFFNLLYYVFFESKQISQNEEIGLLQKNGSLQIGLVIFFIFVPIISAILSVFINLIPYKNSNRNQRFSRSLLISLISVNLFFTITSFIMMFRNNIGEYNNNRKNVLNERSKN